MNEIEFVYVNIVIIYFISSIDLKTTLLNNLMILNYVKNKGY